MLLWTIGLLAFICGIWYLLDRWYRGPLVDNEQQKSVFITGTDSGFGRALALRLDGLGVKVYAGCYTEDGAKDLQRSASSKMRIFNVDVSKVDSIQRAKEIVEEDLSPGQGLWGVVNNAGIHRGLFIGLTSIEDFRAVMEVNFFGIMNVNKVFEPLVKKARGRIVNVGSVLSRSTGFGEPYIASKAALISYNDGLRRWMKPFDVHVATMEPGYHKTHITSESFILGDVQRNWDNLPKALKEEYGEEFLTCAKNVAVAALNHFPLANFNRVESVIDAMTHALFAKHPRARYTIGYDAHFIFRPGMWLPDWLLDLIVMKICRFYAVLRQRHLQNGLQHCKH